MTIRVTGQRGYVNNPTQRLKTKPPLELAAPIALAASDAAGASFDWMLPLYIICAVGLAGGEAFALRRSDDGAYPITHYVRKVMGYSHVFRWWTLVGLAWVFLHFAIDLT